MVLTSRDEVVDFARWLAARNEPDGSLILRALECVGPTGQRNEVIELSGPLPPAPEEPVDELLVPHAAWRVSSRWSQSVVISWGDEEGENFSILVEISEDGVLEDLLLGEFAEQMIAGLKDADDGRVRVETWDVAHAGDVVGQAWRAAAAETRPRSSGLRANQWFAATQLEPLVGERLAEIGHRDEPVDLLRGMSATEFDQANAAARSTLRAAVGQAAVEQEADPSLAAGWRAVVSCDVAGLEPHERDGLLFLEWADWLGIAIGLSRLQAPIEITPTLLVDLINRCPEVSSSIASGDREYVEWALSIAIEVLEGHGALSNATLNQSQQSAVVPAMWGAWAPVSEADEVLGDPD